MQKLLLLGDEAIAQGAIDAGISGVYAYPGTPSTEITEYIQSNKSAIEKGVKASWTTNEKTAMETALGMSYTGKRAMVCMKHVGMNVAADPFLNSSITGCNGGLIIVAADDPSMHSSQNEQDSRFYGKFAQIPILEPANQQEAYNMAVYGFELSEKFQLPVMLRITTRLAHSRSGVELLAEKKSQNNISLPQDLQQFVLLPAIARRRYQKLLDRLPEINKESCESKFNTYIDGSDKSMGIIACGLAYNYLMENYPNGCPFPILKIGQYPLPIELIKKIVDATPKTLILEEGYPVVEEQIRGLLGRGVNISGRFDKTVPFAGELNPNVVAKVLGKEDSYGTDSPELIVSRPPSLCPGCPHIDSFTDLLKAMESHKNGRIFGDIGCYTLSALPPFKAINSCVDMGASITMARGAAEAGLYPAVAVIGDSTFTHSGMTGLLDAVIAKAPITVLILDNSTTGMTGGQDSAAYHRLKSICLGLGVEEEHLKIITPLKKESENNTEIIKKELDYKGVSVIIPTRECIQTLNRRMREKSKSK